MPCHRQTKICGFYQPAQLGTGKRLAARSDDIDADGDVDFGAKGVELALAPETVQVRG